MSSILEQLAVDLLKQLLLQQINQATSSQVAGVSSFAQQVANEQIARDQQTFVVLQQILGKLGQVDADVSNLISNLPQRGEPVTLPSIPPKGYGGASMGDIASAVWNHMEPGSSRTVGYWQELMGALALNFGQTIRLPVYDNGLMSLVYDYANEFEPTPPSTSPDFDLTTILPTDANVADWLNRIDTQGNIWALNANGFAASSNLITGFGYWICEIDPLMFARFKAQLVQVAAFAPPVWPGLANVTLGAATPLAVGVTVTAPMDGVLILITGVPAKQGYFTFDDVLSYRNIGALAFENDDGDEEYPQLLGFQSALYCPKTMTRATAVKIRTTGGVTGTVTPWTIN